MNKQVISIKQTSSRLERFIHKTTQLPLVRKGPQFFTLHEKFEELYTESATHIDEIAERILAIGGKPVATMKEYLEISSIQEAAYGETAEGMVEAIMKDYEMMLVELKKAWKSLKTLTTK